MGRVRTLPDIIFMHCSTYSIYKTSEIIRKADKVAFMDKQNVVFIHPFYFSLLLLRF
jgi:hypothetical protein